MSNRRLSKVGTSWPAALAALLIVLFAGAALAVDKTEVGVVFELTDKHYLDEFKDSQVPVLLDSAAAAAAEALNEKIRFLQFTTKPTAAYRLTVKLDRAEGSASDAPAEFGFHISLSGPDVRDDAKTYIKFRDMEHYSDLFVAVDDLVNEIKLRLEQADHAPLVAGVLKYIAIAQGGQYVPQPPRWVVATDPAAYCIDVDSRFKIWNKFPASSDVSRAGFEATEKESNLPGQLLLYADQSVDPELIDKLKGMTAGDLQVQQIYILVYHRFCTQPVAPANVDFHP